MIYSTKAIIKMLERVTHELGGYIRSDYETRDFPHPEWGNPTYRAAIDMLLELKVQERKP
jgi:hypothetical protein